MEKKPITAVMEDSEILVLTEDEESATRFVKRNSKYSQGTRIADLKEWKLDKGIGKLEFVAEEITRLILYSYSHIYNCTWSLPAKCTENLHYLQIIQLMAD